MTDGTDRRSAGASGTGAGRLITPELTAAFKRLPRYARLAWLLARDPDVPPASKALLAGGILYSVSPIDLVPGFIPVVGQLDDLLVLLSTLNRALKVLGPERTALLLQDAGISEAELAADRDAVAQALRVAAREAWRLGKAGARVAGRATLATADFAGRAALATARMAGQAGGQLWRAARDTARRQAHERARSAQGERPKPPQGEPQQPN